MSAGVLRGIGSLSAGVAVLVSAMYANESVNAPGLDYGISLQ